MKKLLSLTLLASTAAYAEPPKTQVTPLEVREFQAIPGKEGMLLKLLVEREGEVVSRDEILNQVWGYDAFPSNRTVDNFIVRLRKLFEVEPKSPRYLHSVRGMGYKFTRGKV